ncbi:BrxA family protein [uncultured Thiohalocapsa sp.]|uniref:BrxA family protein n=1 Tax=uncultured Thiohalocapsa sp. TaxID=768990 RepID=UPI0025E47053|nr:BrxA family protein [uncultured Thiohalocapsa sp.]
MTPSSASYNTRLQAGLGMLEETRRLLDLYQPGMTTSALYDLALTSGQFPLVSARRLRNIVAECFAPRYIRSGVAIHLKALAQPLSAAAFQQLLLVHTALANPILADFIREAYWARYTAGHPTIGKADALAFVREAIRAGKTRTAWSDSTRDKVAGYLIGACADFGLLATVRAAQRQIQPPRLQSTTLIFCAYWLHLNNLGDQGVLNHPLWSLFALQSHEVAEAMKPLARDGWWIIQSAAGAVRITWLHANLEEVTHVLAQG